WTNCSRLSIPRQPHPTYGFTASTLTGWKAVRRTGFMEYRLDVAPHSYRWDVRGSDDVAPLLGFVGDELAELGWCERGRRAAELGDPRVQFGIGETRINLLVDFVDDVGRRAVWGAYPIPRTHLITWDKLA